MGIPDEVVPELDLNFADEAGTGKKAWPGFEFAGFNGEAFSMFFGIDVTGCAFSTSLFASVSSGNSRIELKAYPACIGV